jgi:large subunit ribosomal protein L32
MAVQKSRVSPSRRGMRRAHDALSAKQLARIERARAPTVH